MISTILILPLIISFFITLLLLPVWIKKAKQIGLLWEDVHKIGADKVAGSGGVTAFVGFIAGVLVFIAYRTFNLQTNTHLIEMFSALLVITLLAMTGLVDDLLGWKKGGLSIGSRLIFAALASIPLIVINAGKSTIAIPFNGLMDLGLIYPLILIPVGIVGATTTFNFLAGFNGLEAGQGIIMLAALAAVAYFTGSSWLAIIALCMIVSLIAFLFYNIYPAKVFPGDVMTYSIGGLIAIMAILGNFEKVAVFFFIPYILETGLKLRGKLIPQSFGLPNPDGSLSLRYKKFYGLEHISIWLYQQLGIKPTEKRVVYSLWLFQILIILIGFIIFRQGIFI